MARIAGVDIPREKRSYLINIYGIGTSTAQKLLKKLTYQQILV